MSKICFSLFNSLGGRIDNLKMDIDYIVRQLEAGWEFVGDIKLKQLLLLALIIYMLPYIIRTIFDVIGLTIRLVLQYVLVTVIISVLLNLYWENPQSVGEGFQVASNFFRVQIKYVMKILRGFGLNTS